MYLSSKQKRIADYNLNPTQCLQCQNSLEYNKKNNKFCSKNCAAIYNNLRKKPRSAESKQKTSNSIKKLIVEGVFRPSFPRRITHTQAHTKLYGMYQCHSCKRNFWKTTYTQKCCSKICRDNICSQNKCKKTQINYFNKYENKTVILQSSWEVQIAKWLDSININWSRPVDRIKWYDNTLKKCRTYLPDFFLTDFNYYLDVKNPLKMKEDKDKIDQLTSFLPLFVGDIQQIKDFVEHLNLQVFKTSSTPAQ